MKIVEDGTTRYIVTEDGIVKIMLQPGLPDVMGDVKKLTAEQLDTIIRNEGLPVAPGVAQNTRLWLAMSIVQNFWFTCTKGEVPAGVLDGHQERIKKYERALVSAKTGPTATVAKPATPRPSNLPVRRAGPRVSDRRYAIKPDHDPAAADGFVKFSRWIYETLVEAGPDARLNISETIERAKARGVTFGGADGGVGQVKFQLNKLAELGLALYFPVQTEIPPAAPAAAVVEPKDKSEAGVEQTEGTTEETTEARS